MLYDRVDKDSHTAADTLFFSDGSSITVNQIPNDGAPKVVTFETKKIEWLRFQATDGEGRDLGLSEIEVYPAPESYTDYVSWVNPYIETAKGRYFFFVTGSLPFGMISSAPLTRNINQGGGGYNYNSTTVLGFPQIHNWMISGLSLMPVKDEVDVCGGVRLGVLLSPMRVRSFNPAIIVYFWIPTRYGWNRPLRIEWGFIVLRMRKMVWRRSW